MNEEQFNLNIRKFLKKVGITAQREIEQAVRAAIEGDNLSGDAVLGVKVNLVIDELDLSVNIDGDISLT